MFSPHLGGRVCPAAPEMRGAWLGFSWGHTRNDFFRAILESIAYEYAWYLRILRGLAPELDLVEARVIGGGARSEAWNQIKADVLSVPYQKLVRKECGAWGSALVAGKACGLITDLAEAATASRILWRARRSRRTRRCGRHTMLRWTAICPGSTSSKRGTETHDERNEDLCGGRRPRRPSALRHRW